MSYSVEEINSCTKKLLFTFESMDLSSQIQQKLNQKRKSISIKGFRKGKAPMQMVEQMYGREVESEALNAFVSGQLYTAINESDLKVVGEPVFDDIDYKSKENMSFSVTVELFPEIGLADYSGYEFTQEKAEFTDEELEQVRADRLRSKAEMVALEDESVAVENGYFAVMNFQGVKPDGERPENMQGKEFLLEIGSGQFIPGFEEGMLGMKKGESREVKVTFPEDYQAPELQGIDVIFEVDLVEIKKQTTPELSDELAKEFGFDSVEDFETKTRDNGLEEKRKASEEKVKQDLIEKLVADNEFDVPNAMVFQQEDFLKQDLNKTLQQQGFNEEQSKEYFEKWSEDLRTKAEFQVRSGLILDHLSRKFEIEAGDEDIEQKIAETSKKTGIEAEQLRKYYLSDEKVKANMLFALREEKTIKRILSEVSVVAAL
jgi:trigger factor